jgi:HAD superfamily hydrolase (TIGR01509 family)
MAGLLGVLLDVDGTLVDSNDAHARAWLQALSEAGIQAEFATIRRLIGKGGDKLLPEAVGVDAASSEGQSISKRRGEIFRSQFLPRLRAFPRAQDLLTRMRNRGLLLAIASSAHDDELKSLMRICGADELVAARTSSDDGGRSKPDPDIVGTALERVALLPSQAILLGDTPYDVEAGQGAGVAVVALRCGGWSDADLKGAIAVYDSPADLLTHFEESPFVR